MNLSNPILPSVGTTTDILKQRTFAVPTRYCCDKSLMTTILSVIIAVAGIAAAVFEDSSVGILGFVLLGLSTLIFRSLNNSEIKNTVSVSEGLFEADTATINTQATEILQLKQRVKVLEDSKGQSQLLQAAEKPREIVIDNSAEISSLQQKIQTLKPKNEQVEGLEASLAEARGTVSANSDEITDLKKQLKALSANNANIPDLREPLEGAQAEIEAKEAQIVELQGRIQALTESKAGHQTALDAAHKEISTKDEELSKLRDQIQTVRADLQKSIEAGQLLLQNSQNASLNTVTEKDQEIMKVRAEVQRLEASLVESTALITSKDGKILQLTPSAKLLQAANDQLEILQKRVDELELLLESRATDRAVSDAIQVDRLNHLTAEFAEKTKASSKKITPGANTTIQELKDQLAVLQKKYDKLKRSEDKRLARVREAQDSARKGGINSGALAIASIIGSEVTMPSPSQTDLSISVAPATSSRSDSSPSTGSGETVSPPFQIDLSVIEEDQSDTEVDSEEQGEQGSQNPPSNEAV